MPWQNAGCAALKAHDLTGAGSQGAGDDSGLSRTVNLKKVHSLAKARERGQDALQLHKVPFPTKKDDAERVVALPGHCRVQGCRLTCSQAWVRRAEDSYLPQHAAIWALHSGTQAPAHRAACRQSLAPACVYVQVAIGARANG